MSTWEDRMSQRAHERERRQREADAARWRTERDTATANAPDREVYAGFCDVCGQSISLEHSFSVSGIIDVGIEEDGRVYTWITHRGGPQPQCAIYSTRVYRADPR